MTNARLIELAAHFREHAARGDAWDTMSRSGFADFDADWIAAGNVRFESFAGSPGYVEWYESVAQVCESLAYDNTDGPR